MTHRILPLALTLAIVALALAARAQPAERPEPAAPPAAASPSRPPVMLPAEEAERIVALLAEAPAKWSFEPLQILLARMRPPPPAAEGR